MSRIINYAKSLLNRKVDGENIIVNGNFDVWQRGVTFNTQGYTADRWFFSVFENEYDNQGATAIKCTTDGQLDNNTYGISMKNTVSGCYYSLMYVVPTEDIISHQGEELSLAFYATSPDASLSGNIYASMSYTPHEDDPLTDKAVISGSTINTAITSGWTQYYSSFTVPSDARTLVLEVRPETTSGLLPNSKLNVSQVKLEMGAIPTRLNPKSYSQQLSKCEAFYQKTSYAQAVPANVKKFTSSVRLNNKLRKPNRASILIPNTKNKSRGIVNLSPYIRENSIFLDGDSSNSLNNNIIVDSIIIDNEIYPEAKPSPPENITSDNSLLTSGLVVYWSGSNDNNSKITEYNIHYGTSTNDLSDNIAIPISGNHYQGISVSGSITGIDLTVPYYFNITATNSIGVSDPSNTMSHSFEGSPTSSGLQTFSTNAVFEKGSANVSWGYVFSSNTIPSKFIIDCDVSSNFDSSVLSRSVKEYNLGDRLNIDIPYPNSTSGTFYYRVAPVVNALTGIYSQTTSKVRTTAPATESIITYPRTDNVSLYWSAPDSDNGYSITGYVVQYSADSGNISTGSTVTVASQGANNSTNISSLTNNTQYYFRIAALNYAGTGSWSFISTETPGRSPSTCSPPTNIGFSWDSEMFLGSTITSVKDLAEQRFYIQHTGYGNAVPNKISSVASINWTAPADNGGLSVAYYNILVDTSSNFDSANLQSYNTSMFRIKKIKLINKLISDTSTTWYTKCAAVNASGTGIYSAVSSLSTNTPVIMSINNQKFNYSFFNTTASNSNLSHDYYVNERGLVVDSGVSYTGVNCSNLSQLSFVDLSTNNNRTTLSTTGLSAGTDYSFGAAYHNSAGLSDVVCTGVTTPSSLSTILSNVSLYTLTYQRTTRPFVRLLADYPQSSVGTFQVTGIYYSGDPSVYPNSVVASGLMSRSSTYIRQPDNTNLRYAIYQSYFTVPTVASELWIQAKAIMSEGSNTYISSPVNIKLWDPLSKPSEPGFAVNRIQNDLIYFQLNKLLHTSEGTGGDTASNCSYVLNYEDLEGNRDSLSTVTYTNGVGPGSPHIFGVDIDRVFGSNYSISPEIKHKFVLQTKNSTETTESVAYVSTNLSNRRKLIEFWPMFKAVRGNASNYGVYNILGDNQFIRPQRSLMQFAPEALFSILENRPVYTIRLYRYGNYLSLFSNDASWHNNYGRASWPANTYVDYANGPFYRYYSDYGVMRIAKAITTPFDYAIGTRRAKFDLGIHNFNDTTTYTFTNGMQIAVSFVKKEDDIMGVWMEQI